MKYLNSNKIILHFSALIIAVITTTGCAQINHTTAATNQTTSSSLQGDVSTAPAVAAASWAENVVITIDEEANTFRYQSNGIPDHGFAEKYLIPNDVSSQPFADNTADEFTVVNSADYFTESEVDTTITTLPAYIDAVTQTSLGRIGVALSGAQLFNDYENMDRSVVAMDDNVIHDHVPFVDQCNGHTLVNGTSYHYHGVPVCITEGLDQPGEHSTMIGVLEDGFPVYGNKGPNGATVTNADLDECSGHVDATPEFPDSIYHYHLTADEAPYMIDCYHGQITVASTRGGLGGDGPGGNGPGGNRPDFSAIAKSLGVSESDLVSALGDSRPPDFEAAAKTLGIELDALMAVMPSPP